jgi:hypothetical protein
VASISSLSSQSHSYDTQPSQPLPIAIFGDGNGNGNGVKRKANDDDDEPYILSVSILPSSFLYFIVFVVSITHFTVGLFDMILVENNE